jgi:hypothetical protein
MYVIGEASIEERKHLEECAACQATVASLTGSISHFRGAVRNWSDRACAKDRAAELRWTVIPAADHLARLLLPALEVPWYRSLWSGVCELFQPAPPPLDITSKPVLVRNIWGQYGRQKKSWLLSVALQSAVVVIVFTAALTPTVRHQIMGPSVSLVAPALPPNAAPIPASGGGGG